MQIKFKWIGGATWVMQIGSIKIACDPVLCPKGHVQDYKFFKSTRLNSPEFKDADFQDIDFWLLTHNHEDHLDQDGFKYIDNESHIIAHPGVKKQFDKEKYTNTHYLKSSQFFEWEGDQFNITISSVPAYHARSPFWAKIVGNGNGYLLKIEKKNTLYSIYVTGDSVFQPHHAEWFHGEKINMIIANAGSAHVQFPPLYKAVGRITNNSEDIKNMADVLQPEVLIPVHWGTFSHYTELLTPDMFKSHKMIQLPDPGEEIIIESFNTLQNFH